MLLLLLGDLVRHAIGSSEPLDSPSKAMAAFGLLSAVLLMFLAAVAVALQKEGAVVGSSIAACLGFVVLWPTLFLLAAGAGDSRSFGVVGATAVVGVLTGLTAFVVATVKTCSGEASERSLSTAR